jgi:putative ABC transport system permease protein
VASSADRAELTLDDAVAISERAAHVLAVQPEMSRQLQLQYTNTNTNTTIVGTTSNYLEVRKFSLAAGRMFTDVDDAARRRVAVVGPQVAEDLGIGAASSLVGSKIRINSLQFEVIGVLQSKGQGGGFFNPDDQVLIPIHTAKYRLMGGSRIRSISVLSPSEADIPVTMAEVKKILRREHKLRSGVEDDFSIRSQADFLNTLSETTQVFSYLLAGIAAVSLVVGGIGIMNIMLVSVTERTREIGVRKALGATRVNILMQFLVEALVLCMMGGIFGVAIGAGAAWAMQRLLGWSISVGVGSVFIAFLFSAAVGLLFGVWPARRAATLDPIEALRYE